MDALTGIGPTPVSPASMGSAEADSRVVDGKLGSQLLI